MKAFNPSTSQWEDVYVKALDSFPVGVIVEYPTTDTAKLPTGYMFCDGSAISRTEYAELFALIGTSFGAGDGSTTFNLPSKKGLVTVGINSSDTDFNTIGKTGGEKTHKLTVGELPSHNFKIPINVGGSQQLETVQYTGSQSGSQYYVNTNSVGGNQAHNILQPYEVSNFIIKVKPTRVLAGNITNTYSDSQTSTYSCEHINDMMDYSINEVNTGKKWIDGKYIYKKVIDMGTMSSNKQHNISNLSWVVNMYGTAKTNDGNYLPISFANNNGLQYQLSVYPTSTTINVNKGSSITITNSYVTIEYTKSS